MGPGAKCLGLGPAECVCPEAKYQASFPGEWEVPRLLDLFSPSSFFRRHVAITTMLPLRTALALLSAGVVASAANCPVANVSVVAHTRTTVGLVVVFVGCLFFSVFLV